MKLRTVRWAVELGIIAVLGIVSGELEPLLSATEHRMLVISILVYSAWRFADLRRDSIAIGISKDADFRDRITQRIHSDSFWEQRRAIRTLSWVVGSRFGDFPLFPSERRRHSLALWRDWWDRKADTLVWDPILLMFVENQSQEAGPVGRKKLGSHFDL